MILGWFQDLGFNWIQNDETAWCSLFINWLAKENGIEHSKKLDARSWMNIGENAENPSKGDIVVFWRESLANSWKGHVGLFMGQQDDHIYCLGGNQDNQVNIKPYPLSRLLGFRKLNFINT